MLTVIKGVKCTIQKYSFEVRWLHTTNKHTKEYYRVIFSEVVTLPTASFELQLHKVL